jgi:diguanylate cyclase (GGDEF)-like protein
MASTMSLVVGARSERHFEREIGRALSETAFQMADKLDADMASRSRHVRVLAKISAVRDWTEAQKVVNELQLKDPTLAWIGTINTDGIVTASSGRILLGADGTVLLGPANIIGRPLPVESLKLAQSKGSGWAIETWPDGQRYLTGYARGVGQADYSGLGWTILARQPLQAAYENAQDASREIFLWGVGFAALFSAIAWFAASLITRPLHAIADAAVRLRRGEPGVEIPQLGGATEVADLSTSLRDLVASLDKTQNALSKMEDAAYHDTLTGLPNRRMFDEYLGKLVAATPAPDFALLSLDLDRFKPINDTLGHHAGDIVLRQVSARMLSCLRSNDVVARIGGDEFVIIVHAESGKATPSLQEVAERLIKAVNEPILTSGKAVRVGCSIGIANGLIPGETVQEMLDRADRALYQAKEQGRNCAVAA